MIASLRRAEGQVRGIHRMVADGARCSDVLPHLAAVTAALDAAGLALLDAPLHDCLDRVDDRTETAELVTAVERFVRR